MPIHVHIGPSPVESTSARWRRCRAGRAPTSTGPWAAYLSEVVWWSSRSVTFMIWAGVFERYPKLKFSIVEGAIDWVPDYLRLLDVRYDTTPQAQKLGDYISHLSMKPSDYFRRNIRLGAACMSPGDGKLGQTIGGECIMWGSDYPHPEGSLAQHERDQRLQAMAGLSDEEITAQLSGQRRGVLQPGRREARPGRGAHRPRQGVVPLGLDTGPPERRAGSSRSRFGWASTMRDREGRGDLSLGTRGSEPQPTSWRRANGQVHKGNPRGLSRHPRVEVLSSRRDDPFRRNDLE